MSGFDVQTFLATANLIGLAAVAGVVARYSLSSRRLKLEEKQDARSGEVSINDLLRADLTRTRLEHEQCTERLNTHQNEILLLQRQVLALTLRAAITGEDVPPSVRSALETLAEVVKGTPRI